MSGNAPKLPETWAEIQAAIARTRELDALDVLSGKRTPDSLFLIPRSVARQSKPVFPPRYLKSEARMSDLTPEQQAALDRVDADWERRLACLKEPDASAKLRAMMDDPGDLDGKAIAGIAAAPRAQE